MSFKNTIIIISILLLSTPLFAQSQTNKTDPSGYVLKYDASFSGIGPEVYFLPKPRTKEELVRDSYKEISSFQDSIERQFLFERLITDYQKTSNADAVQPLFTKSTSIEEWNGLIETAIANGNIKTATSLMNEYAKKALLNHETQRSISILEAALDLSQKEKNLADIQILQANLSSVLFFNKELERAGSYEEAYYKEAVENKSIVNQAKSLLKIALIQAYDKDFKSSENTIIRRAIPLFNKAKDFENKTKAWVILAEIYQLQNKHTEAQWFLIQARSLADNKKLNQQQPQIEYMLGLSKYIQNNLKVSKEELTRALDLAKKEEKPYLELAVLEKLGQINVKQNKIDEAEKQLKEYWDLRNQLFKS